MNRLERSALDQIDEVVRFASTLTPRNPADVAAIFKNATTSTALNKRVAYALGDLRCADFEGVEAQMREATAVIDAYKAWERNRDT